MTTTHDPTICEKTGHGYHHYKNWSYAFQCPVCSRTGKFCLNFLGQRNVICNGQKFTKEYKPGRDPYPWRR